MNYLYCDHRGNFEKVHNIYSNIAMDSMASFIIICLQYKEKAKYQSAIPLILFHKRKNSAVLSLNCLKIWLRPNRDFRLFQQMVKGIFFKKYHFTQLKKLYQASLAQVFYEKFYDAIL